MYSKAEFLLDIATVCKYFKNIYGYKILLVSSRSQPYFADFISGGSASKQVFQMIHRKWAHKTKNDSVVEGIEQNLCVELSFPDFLYLRFVSLLCSVFSEYLVF